MMVVIADWRSKGRSKPSPQDGKKQKHQQEPKLKFRVYWAPCHLVPGEAAFNQDVNQDVQKQSFPSCACKKSTACRKK
jgi:hypothetical protein